MKKTFTFVAILFALIVFASSQSNAQSMYFCEGVDSDGYPITPSSTFNISSDGGYLYVLTRLPFEIRCNSAYFVIYRNGSYDNTIYMDTEKNWTWFWKQITFYKSGDYEVYVYDCYDDLLTSGELRINFK